jgi:signal transduction histidine kinase
MQPEWTLAVQTHGRPNGILSSMPSSAIAPYQFVRDSDDAHALVDAERLRIARELHDVVAFSFATISVQAGVAVHVADKRPEMAAEALRAIKTISGEASSELRAILGVLRRTDAADTPPTGDRMARLPAMAATTTGAGLPTHVVVSGSVRPLPPALDRAAYRIVQEALTNALRHAGPAAASVSVVYERNRLLLDVVDDGRGITASSDQPVPGSGHGIAGMRERALAVGGELEVGPQPAGGFRVRATLPLEEES